MVPWTPPKRTLNLNINININKNVILFSALDVAGRTHSRIRVFGSTPSTDSKCSTFPNCIGLQAGLTAISSLEQRLAALFLRATLVHLTDVNKQTLLT
jgi:hypothetical protein